MLSLLDSQSCYFIKWLASRRTTMHIPPELSTHYDPETGTLTGGVEICRRLSDLRTAFADSRAYAALLAAGNPVIYKVVAVEPGTGRGDLHYGLGILYPGKVGNEYFLTKGHYHQTREAAEVYIGLKGEGAMLLEDEATGESRLEPLGAGRIVYVPGHTAHRTMNTGSEPLVYFGIYPANAGHDYGALSQRNFLKILVEENGAAVLKNRPATTGSATP
jgi:glucose-6-phosphate isomerase, archaeal